MRIQSDCLPAPSLGILTAHFNFSNSLSRFSFSKGFPNTGTSVSRSRIWEFALGISITCSFLFRFCMVTARIPLIPCPILVLLLVLAVVLVLALVLVLVCVLYVPSVYLPASSETPAVSWPLTVATQPIHTFFLKFTFLHYICKDFNYMYGIRYIHTHNSSFFCTIL